ncbi:GCG_CRPN prefix-to-repeats domain-containing protein [Methylocella sp.]|uniref:GCG_CRPN prefix-to-repeats domain-containing protein n=1 Tax=Methylocella sp. TaxID=1978226 RepID=UPI0037844D9E
MRTTTALALGALAFGAAAFEAQALPATPAPLPPAMQTTQVARGCGPGWTRDAWGRCVPIRRAAPTRCWWEWTPWGRRRVCRW